MTPPTESSLPLPTDSRAPEATLVAQETPGRNRRLWALALGTAAAWHLDPALIELADIIALTACANNKSLARDSIAQMRAKANSLRAQIPPLPASALAKVVRRAEAACGAVLDKGARVHEVQTSWEHFLTCVRVRDGDSTRRG